MKSMDELRAEFEAFCDECGYVDRVNPPARLIDLGAAFAWLKLQDASVNLELPDAMRRGMDQELSYGQRCCVVHNIEAVWEAGVEALRQASQRGK